LTFSPIISLPMSWKFGRPSRKRMRSVSCVGVLHLVDRLLVLLRRELLEAPVP
jgi:hypothetical protein